MKKFGLIGYPLTHSFSKKYYTSKFESEGITDVNYELYAIPDITDFVSLVEGDSQLMGINVTIPYKIAVMAYLHQLSPEAKAIAAVNCIRIERTGTKDPVLTGYNTDVYGFEESLKPLLRPWHDRALVLGTGGAAKAVTYTLSKLGIDFAMVSRSTQYGQCTYDQLNGALMDEYPVLVNTTPLGTFPNTADCPAIPYEHLSEKHLLYDLVYNPPQTEFLSRGLAQGATVKNGLEMLELQAERNWEIWNETV